MEDDAIEATRDGRISIHQRNERTCGGGNRARQRRQRRGEERGEERRGEERRGEERRGEGRVPIPAQFKPFELQAWRLEAADEVGDPGELPALGTPLAHHRNLDVLQQPQMPGRQSSDAAPRARVPVTAVLEHVAPVDDPRGFGVDLLAGLQDLEEEGFVLAALLRRLASALPISSGPSFCTDQSSVRGRNIRSPRGISAPAFCAGQFGEFDGLARGGEEEAVDVVADFGGEIEEWMKDPFGGLCLLGAGDGEACVFEVGEIDWVTRTMVMIEVVGGGEGVGEVGG